MVMILGIACCFLFAGSILWFMQRSSKKRPAIEKKNDIIYNYAIEKQN